MRAYEGHDGDDDDNDEKNEKDYLMDRPALPLSSSERDKWSKLIPEDVGGGSRTRAAGSLGLKKHGLAGLKDIWANNRDVIAVLFYTALSLYTRLHRIGRSNTVVWDEAHFGKFGSYYLNQTFYFDVHPPLGKMLVGLAGALSGYNGSFDFPSGAVYPDHVPFTSMRVMLALPGVAMVPLAWGTAQEFGFSYYTRHLAALMTLCDMAWLVISRFILLDSMLLFFTFTTVYFLACFHNQQRYPFTIDWWIWLILTGVSVGCVLR